MSKTAYLIRHGLIQSNQDHVYSGRSTEQLTEAGERQAEQVGREIAGFGIQLIYTSPLQRTVQTARILARHCGAGLVYDTDLIEMDLGPWTGLSRSEVRQQFPAYYELWISEPDRLDAAGIETLQAVQKRVVRSLDRFLRSAESIVAFVTHAVAVKTAVLHFRHLPLSLYHRVEVPNLSIHRIILDVQGSGQVERLK